jgi:single-stranded-DNA-specific exonuclease
LLEADPQLLQGSLVLHQQGWHEGVIGIVASRLVDRYARPVVVIAVKEGMGKGSARCPEGFDLFEALKGCARHLEKFGGHEGAAGLTVRAENIPAFRAHFDKLMCAEAAATDFVPTLDIDIEIAPEEISPNLADEIERLAPFGKGNPEPLFMLSDVHVVSARRVGGRHIQMRLSSAKNSQTRPIDAVLFNANTDKPPPKRFHRLACNVRWNRWQDRKSIQLIIRDFLPA